MARWAEAGRRLANLPRSAYGGALAHAGLGVVVIGIVATTAWRSGKHPGNEAEGIRRYIAGYHLTFEGVAPREGSNYRERVGLFKVARNGQGVTMLEPSKREFTVERSGTTKRGIQVRARRGDLYVVLGDQLKDGAYSVRLYFHPRRSIWLGAVAMCHWRRLCLLSDRRLRVGAPKRARALSQDLYPAASRCRPPPHARPSARLSPLGRSLVLPISLATLPVKAVQPDESAARPGA